jgi:hypothetical protein
MAARSKRRVMPLASRERRFDQQPSMVRGAGPHIPVRAFADARAAPGIA